MNTKVIIYDDDCGFCDWCLDIIEAHSPAGSYEFVGVSNPRAADIATQADFILNSEDPESFILYNPHNNSYLDKSRAVTEIARTMSGPHHLWFYLGSITPRLIGDWVYDRVAKNRHRLGPLVGRKTCRVR